MLALLLVRCSALYQIKSYDPQLEKFTVNSLDFRLCNITYQVGGLGVSFRLIVFTNLTPSVQGVDYWGYKSHLKPTL